MFYVVDRDVWKGKRVIDLHVKDRPHVQIKGETYRFFAILKVQ